MGVTYGNTDLGEKFSRVKPLLGQRNLWVGTSCSLLHSPIDLNDETRLDTEVKSWFAFAIQKCEELALLTKALNQPTENHIATLETYSAPIRARKTSTRVNNAAVAQRLAYHS